MNIQEIDKTLILLEILQKEKQQNNKMKVYIFRYFQNGI